MPVTDLADRLLLNVKAGIDEATTRIDDAIASVQRFMQRVMLGLEGSLFRPDEALLDRWECELLSFDKWQAAQRRKWYCESWIHWEEAAKLSRSEGFQSLKRSLGAHVSTLSRPELGQFWDQPSFPSVSKKSRIPSVQAFSLNRQRQALNEGFQLLGTPDHSARPTWLATVPELAVILPDDERPPINAGRKLTPSSTDSSNGARAALILLPGAETLEHIPLWIQAAVRLGTRFLRVAASGLPIAVQYGRRDKSNPCCVCRKEHAPVIDEYYFWLQDARRFNPADAPAPQDANLHVNTPGIDVPTSSRRHMDPRTGEADPTSDWDAPTPRMLAWKSQPLVHLHWTRVHMGVLLDPRRSTEGIPLTEEQLAELNLDLVGRTFDSLIFSLFLFANNPVVGFRYDIATDRAVVLPEAVTSTEPPALPLPASLTAPLTAFPYFLYFEPGAPLVPVDTFSTSLVVAASLRVDCHFEEASDWLRLSYDPLGRDNSWMQCEEAVEIPGPSLAKDEENTVLSDSKNNPFVISLRKIEKKGASDVAALARFAPDVSCCPSAPVKTARARGRAATLEYLETLLEWTNALRCRDSFEASQQALTLLAVVERVLGPKPARIQASDNTEGAMTVAAFAPYAPPLNPRLMELYYRVGASMESLRASMNKRLLKNGKLGRDLAHFGSHQRFDFESTHTGPNECGSSCCISCCHPYRFTFVLSKAMQWVSLAKASAAAMQSAIEKADSEALSSLRLAQERQMTELALEISKNSYRAADWDAQALDKQMAHAIARFQYFQRLIELGVNTGELAHVAATTASTASRTSATIVDGIGQGMAAVPDMWVGIAGIAGTPLQFNQMPVGVKMGTGFAAAARILNTVADISGTSAGLSLTEAGWERREDEWQHSADLSVLEIQQIKRQRLASRRRLDNALRELDNNHRRIEHSAEVQDFARDKTSKYELYLYLQQENLGLYRQCYELALQTTQEAQQALRFELGDFSFSYIPPSLGSWSSLHEGLLAGEKLELALCAMERAHMTKHCREYELTKHVSLRLHFPAAFVLLKATGHCEVDLPEWLFDLDYPGHYMRRIRAVSLTVPCVAGPYTGVHCKLQQLNSAIRFRPMRSNRDTCKCCPTEKNHDRRKTLPAPCPNEPHIWRRYAGTEAIATSTGQSDSGLYELSFNDARYLPFEYSGAVSRWRIELPPENNQFDFDSLSDLVMHISYTAREGGEDFAWESNMLAQRFLPGDGWRFFDVRHELPEVWNVLRREVECEVCARPEETGVCEEWRCRCGGEKHQGTWEGKLCCGQGKDNEKGWCEKCRKNHRAEEWKCRTHHEDYSDDDETHDHGHKRRQAKPTGEKKRKRPTHAERNFHLFLTRERFPFLTGRRDASVTSIHLLLDIRGCDPCTAKIRFTPPPKHSDGKACVDTEDIPLVPRDGGMLEGSLSLKQPVELEDRSYGEKTGKGNGKGVIGTFSLPCKLKGVCGAWLLCNYHAKEKRCCNGDRSLLGCGV